MKRKDVLVHWVVFDRKCFHWCLAAKRNVLNLFNLFLISFALSPRRSSRTKPTKQTQRMSINGFVFKNIVEMILWGEYNVAYLWKHNMQLKREKHFDCWMKKARNKTNRKNKNKNNQREKNMKRNNLLKCNGKPWTRSVVCAKHAYIQSYHV